MSKYPNLTDMGVLHPEEIVRYTINSLGYTDHLRIIYDRPKGSMLPACRSYEFLRVQKTAKGNEVVMESNPALRAALAELKDVVESKASKKDTAEALLDELHGLEEDFAYHTAALKALIEEIRQR